jgi:CRISPR type III-B/RAMP module-associated protein Cmr5
MPTLDQLRAQYAWEKALNSRALKKFDEYCNLAKGAPALVMGNGLMSALALWRSRGKEHATQLLDDVLIWLAPRTKMESPQFDDTMARLTQMGSLEYMAATDETLALLRWLRQCADAVAEEDVAR